VGHRSALVLEVVYRLPKYLLSSFIHVKIYHNSVFTTSLFAEGLKNVHGRIIAWSLIGHSGAIRSIPDVTLYNCLWN